MSNKEKLKYEFFEGKNSKTEMSLLDIFTSEEAKPKEGNWFYKIFGKEDYLLGNPKFLTMSNGNITLCTCKECQKFGAELYEYFSIYQALKWVSDNAPDKSCMIFFSSERFLYDYENQLWRFYGEIYECPILIELGKAISDLLLHLDIEAVQDTYANKEIIPYISQISE